MPELVGGGRKKRKTREKREKGVEGKGGKKREGKKGREGRGAPRKGLGSEVGSQRTAVTRKL